MKKTLIALAALAATGASFAQVTLYGTMDAGLYSINVNTAAGTATITGLGSSQMSSSKLGFMGTEDLGGGTSAIFKLEGGIGVDAGSSSTSGTRSVSSNNQATGAGVVTAANGTVGNTSLNGAQGLVFGRFSYVGLKGGMGELHLGREYTSTFIQGIAAVDPFQTNGVAGSNNMMLNLGLTKAQFTATSASNMVTYTTPDLGGLTGTVQAYFGENSSTSAIPGAAANVGDGYSATLRYAGGPVYVSLGQQSTKGIIQAAVAPGAANSQVATFGDYTVTTAAAAYNFGVAKVNYMYSQEQLVGGLGGTSTATNTSNGLGVIVPFGATNLKAQYIASVANSGAAGAVDAKGNIVSVGADYALSKRTTVYGVYSNVTNDAGNTYYVNSGLTAAATGALTAGGSSSGYALGLKHTF